MHAPPVDFAGVQVLAIVADRPNDTNDMLVDEWRERGIDMLVLSPSEARSILRGGDVALARLDVLPSLDGIGAGMLDLRVLEHRGVRVLNPPHALLAVHDKLRTAPKLHAAGLPHPRTVHVTTHSSLAGVPLPAVVKPRFGSWGSDVFRCDSAEELDEVLAAIASRPWFQREGALVQELVPPCGYDLRVLVACGEVVGAEMRVAAPGEWRTNISLGGTHRMAIPAPDAVALARAAVASVGMDFCGVDLLPTRDGWTVIELNGAVDFTVGYSLPGRDVCEDVAAALQLAGNSGEALEHAVAL